MRLRELLSESIDQTAADELMRSLVAVGDPSAKYFQATRYDPRHKSVDAAQRAAEMMVKKDELRNDAKKSQKRTSVTVDKPTVDVKPTKDEKPTPTLDRAYSDRFYGNQYTGSLGRSQYQPGELSRILGITPNSKIGRAIGAVQAAAKPLSDIKRAFQLGKDFASRRR